MGKFAVIDTETNWADQVMSIGTVIAGVGITHRGETEYLKSIPDSSKNNNLGNLPSVSPQA